MRALQASRLQIATLEGEKILLILFQAEEKKPSFVEGKYMRVR